MVRVAINGFGRIGRMVVRAGITRDDIEFVACNDLTDKKTLAHLFKHDSSQGKFSGDVHETEQGISINGKEILVFAEKNPSQLPWGELNIDVVIESTGIFRTKEQMQLHVQAGAKKVMLSAPAKGEEVKTFVLGVNEHEYNSKTDNFVSNASCTTNCLAPLVKVLDDNFGVKKGYMTTIHAYTGDQRLLDAPHTDLRRARSAAANIIPTSTGAAIAVGKVMPHLAGKLDGIAIRVPVSVGSVTDFVCELSKETSKEEINWLMAEVAQHHLHSIVEYSEAPLVSSDIVGNPHSSIFDSSLTFVNGTMVKIVSWYDNEWGYSNRVCDFVAQMMRQTQ
ncbi:type I glyceraldehyde-3-phosphate dehydrogenase [Candidatus Woesearchaeota archaeon]|nr:type I glyceraldehyde-3-phosphate dehydrogenase [Candidatus Woesearchaeota archaeon]